MIQEEASPEPHEENGKRLSNILLDSKDNKAIGEANFDYFLNRFRELSDEYHGYIPLRPVVWGVLAERGVEGEEARKALYKLEKTGRVKVSWLNRMPVLSLLPEMEELVAEFGHVCAGCARLPSCEKARAGEPLEGCFGYESARRGRDR